MKKGLTIVLTALCSLLTAGAQQSSVMTLVDCIRMGVERNLGLKSDRIDISKGQTQISQSRAMLLPQISGQLQVVDYLKNPVQVSGGTLVGMDFPETMTWQKVHSMQYNSTAALSLQMPLYNQSILSAIDAAKTVLELNQLNYEKAVETLTMQIGKVYYAAQAAHEQEQLLAEDVKRMQTLSDITKAMLEQGVILETDYTRISINISNLETQRKQYQMLYDQQRNTLRFLLDMRADDPIDVTRMTTELQPIASQGMSNSLPEQRLIATQRTLIDKQIKLTRAGYLPSVGLFAQAGYLGYQERFGDFFKGSESHQYGMAGIGLQVSIPIFDASSRRLKIRQYRYDAEKAANSQLLLNNNLNREYVNASLQLTQNEEIYATQRRNRQQAQDVYQLTELRYREGVSSMTELLQDDMRLISAEQQMVQAHAGYNLAQLEKLRLEGNLNALR